jgi:hypothetical protein
VEIGQCGLWCDGGVPTATQARTRAKEEAAARELAVAELSSKSADLHRVEVSLINLQAEHEKQQAVAREVRRHAGRSLQRASFEAVAMRWLSTARLLCDWRRVRRAVNETPMTGPCRTPAHACNA